MMTENLVETVRRIAAPWHVADVDIDSGGKDKVRSGYLKDVKWIARDSG